MSEHLIAEANRHAKALPKMTLPTTKPNDLDLAWYRRECELLQDRNEALERENAALRQTLDTAIVLLRKWNKNDVTDDVVIDTRKAIYAALKEAQP
jgi:predicted RNA-binding protein with PUA domain